ncbi:MAG: hypothetical protein K0S34_945 [Bacillales bacterium]|jgi:hypothetical protein|nr:hypothetical protein [Bacillales bacterium]
MGMIKKLPILILIIFWIFIIIIDFSLSRINKSPIFVIPKEIYKDGGSAEYFGLGYKINKYVILSDGSPEIIRMDFGTWSMKFKHPNSN